MLLKADIVSHIKQFWTDTNKDEVTFENHPFLAMIEKDTDGGGDTLNIPLYLDDGAEGSPDFATTLAIAKASSTGMQGKKFIADWVEDYQHARVSNKLIRETRNNPKLALLRATESNMAARRTLSRRIARYLWRSGWGEKGQISALSGSTFTLTSAADARHYHIGDRLQFGVDLDTSALRDTGDYVSVTKIDNDSGIITTDAPVNLTTSITGIAVSDYVFAAGARPVGASPTRSLPLGVGAYIPDAVPGGSDSFLTLNRSVWPQRLSGLRWPAVGTSTGAVEDVFLRSLTYAAQQEAYVDKVFVSSDIYTELLIAMEGRCEKINEKVGKLGFAGFEFQCGYGQGAIKVFPDPDMPAKHAYGLKMNAWKLITCGELIQSDLTGAGDARDVEDASQLEWRYVFHGQLSCNAPGKNIVIKFA